jgi:hypothetical protein
MSLAILFHFLCVQHVSDINHHQELATVLLNYHIGRLVLSSLCVGDLVRLVLGGARFAGFIAGFSLQQEHHSKPAAPNHEHHPNQPHQISNTQRTEKKTTDVVIQQHSRKLLMMDILMSETC